VEQTITRRHKFKVKGGRDRGDVRVSFFTQRVVGAWNVLPAEVVVSKSFGTFKRLLDRHMDYGRMMECRLICS